MGIFRVMTDGYGELVRRDGGGVTGLGRLEVAVDGAFASGCGCVGDVVVLKIVFKVFFAEARAGAEHKGNIGGGVYEVSIGVGPAEEAFIVGLGADDLFAGQVVDAVDIEIGTVAVGDVVGFHPFNGGAGVGEIAGEVRGGPRFDQTGRG